MVHERCSFRAEGRALDLYYSLYCVRLTLIGIVKLPRRGGGVVAKHLFKRPLPVMGCGTARGAWGGCPKMQVPFPQPGCNQV